MTEIDLSDFPPPESLVTFTYEELKEKFESLDEIHQYLNSYDTFFKSYKKFYDVVFEVMDFKATTTPENILTATPSNLEELVVRLAYYYNFERLLLSEGLSYDFNATFENIKKIILALSC